MSAVVTELIETIPNHDITKQPERTISHTGGNEMESTALGYLAAGFGAAISVIGAGLGIGKLAAAAMEASGRQPEVAGQVRTSMIIAAALIEGVTLFAEVICIILATK
jgi:F-type H+-transporting ATPase subunit c